MRLEKDKGNKREDILQKHHTLRVKRESIRKALTFGKGKHKEGIKIVVVIMVVVKKAGAPWKSRRPGMGLLTWSDIGQRATEIPIQVEKVHEVGISTKVEFSEDVGVAANVAT